MLLIGKPVETMRVNRKDACSWNVLIVDDDKETRNRMSRTLRYLGARVYTAADGVEGLALLMWVRPTFILSDLHMPKMTGQSMLWNIRRNYRTAHIPVIALTSYAANDMRNHVASVGFDGHISKPFRFGSFLMEILRCLACTGVTYN